MTKEIAIECIDMVIYKRPEVYITKVMSNVKNFVTKMDEFDLNKMKMYISLQQPTKLGGIENIEISSALGYLKDLLNVKKKQLKKRL